MQGNPQQALDYAYLAGLFDGEGSFCIGKQTSGKHMEAAKRKNPWYRSIVRIGMTSKETIDYICKIFPFGSTYCEGVRKDRPSYKKMYRWEAHSPERCLHVINCLLPYLKAKREVALVVKELCDGWKIPHNRKIGTDPEEIQRREDLWSKARKLNAVGAAATTK